MAAVALPAAPTRRRRRYLPWVAAILAAISLLGVGATELSASRARLEASPFVFGPGPGSALRFESQPLGGDLATFVPGAAFLVVFTVENHHRYPMTIDTLGDGLDRLLRLVDITDFTGCRQAYDLAGCPRVELPLTVSQDQELQLGFRFALRDCIARVEGGLQSFDAIPVHTTTLGIGRSTSFGFRHPVGFRTTETVDHDGPDCPPDRS